MADIVAFIEARIAEEAALATDAGGGTWSIDCWACDGTDPNCEDCEGRGCGIRGDGMQIYDEGGHTKEQAAHIARHDPARVLREITAKRLMLADHQTGISRHYNCRNRDHIQDWQCERAGCSFEESRYCEICPDSDYLGMCRGVRLLAAPYADHPDYDPAWAVEA